MAYHNLKFIINRNKIYQKPYISVKYPSITILQQLHAKIHEYKQQPIIGLLFHNFQNSHSYIRII